MDFPAGVSLEHTHSYRKIWEWAAILHALDERDMMAPGRKGIGFAVGTETLPSILAAHGVEILATDLPADQSDGRWDYGNQHAANLEALFHPSQIDEAEFRRLVSFQPVNMLDLAALPDASFDFAWSSCAMEHLGSLEAGLTFVRDAMRLLKPGGIAVHTTEYNCSSNDATLVDGWGVIYRQRDLEGLDRSLRPMRCGIEPFDFEIGTHSFDLDYDEEPYFQGKSRHIKLRLEDFIATSCLMIVRNAE
jgi:SAM-dependent methyltransferase